MDGFLHKAMTIPHSYNTGNIVLRYYIKRRPLLKAVPCSETFLKSEFFWTQHTRDETISRMYKPSLFPLLRRSWLLPITHLIKLVSHYLSSLLSLPGLIWEVSNGTQGTGRRSRWGEWGEWKGPVVQLGSLSRKDIKLINRGV